jgi:hypothetical protein
MEARMNMADLRWYACVYESEQRIVYGRAPEGSEDVVDDIKRSLAYHDLIGLRSKVFLRKSRFSPEAVAKYCEKKADRNRGDYQYFRVVKLDLRKAPD